MPGVPDKTESLTPLGERVSCMSCDPQLGKVLVLAALFRCALPVLSVAACLTRDPFYNSLQNRALVTKVRHTHTHRQTDRQTDTNTQTHTHTCWCECILRPCQMQAM